MSQPRLTDGNIVLTPFHPRDAKAHLAGEDADMERWLSGGPSTPEGLDRYLEHCRQQWATGGALHHFGIHLDDPGATLIGSFDLRFEQPELTPGQVNLAYGLYPRWRGKGLAGRAVELACPYAAAHGAIEAVIRTAVDNPRSAAVARRCGFEYSGRRRDSQGVPHDWFSRRLPTKRER